MQLARTRLKAADMLVFDIWEVISYSHSILNIVQWTKLVDDIVHAAWPMCKTGRRYAIGLILDEYPLHKSVHAALVRHEFEVYSLGMMNSRDESGYLEYVRNVRGHVRHNLHYHLLGGFSTYAGGDCLLPEGAGLETWLA